jgi:hypothetical protein
VYRSRIDLRVRTDERALWEAWAEELGLGVSEMIRRSVPAYVRAQRPKRTRMKVLSVPEPDRGPSKAVSR